VQGLDAAGLENFGKQLGPLSQASCVFHFFVLQTRSFYLSAESKNAFVDVQSPDMTNKVFPIHNILPDHCECVASRVAKMRSALTSRDQKLGVREQDEQRRSSCFASAFPFAS